VIHLKESIHAATHGPPDPHARATLVDELQYLLVHAEGKSITIGEATDVLRTRGLALVMVLVNMPFLFPIPVPGLSTPAGLAIALYGAYLVARRRPRLPGFLARRSISNHALERLVRVGTRWGRRIEKLLKPRLGFMLWPIVDMVIGLCLVISGLFLSLPLPIPFTNSIPAIAILLLLLGLIERDGVFVLAGQILSMAIFAMTVFVVYLIVKHGWHEAHVIMRSWFHHAPATMPTNS
jgi:hypothetical protein